MRRLVSGLAVLGALAFAPAALASHVTFSGVGGTNVSGGAVTALNAFEAAIGGANNAATPSPQANGFRTINWDGVPTSTAEPHALPGNFFDVISPRGLVLSTPGDSLRVSANDAGSPQVFADINTTYSNNFAAFSSMRIFSPLGSTVTDITFHPAGQTAPATVRAFGAIFINVLIANSSSIEYFDPSGASLGKFFAATGTAKQPEFLGLLYSPELIGRVEITSGTSPLSGATNDNFPTTNVVALDDFAYAEPQQLAGPSLAITAPADGTTVSNGALTVTGTASDPYGIQSLTVNGAAATVAADGTWSAPLTLHQGANTITAVATNKGGASTTVSRSITFTPVVPPPPKPSNVFSISSVKVDKNGKGVLLLSLPGKGAVVLDLSARGLSPIAHTT